MNVVAVCVAFTALYLGLSLVSLRAELVSTLFLLLVLGPLAVIIIGQYLREKKIPDSRKDDRSLCPEDSSEG